MGDLNATYALLAFASWVRQSLICGILRGCFRAAVAQKLGVPLARGFHRGSKQELQLYEIHDDLQASYERR